MKKSLIVLVSLLASTPVFAEDAAPAAVRGKMLVDAGGARLAPVMRVGADGSASIIIDGHVVTVPAATLSVADGKLKTSLTKNQVTALQ